MTVLFETTGKADGQFAFTTKVAGEYKACFTAKGQPRGLAAACRAC